MRIFATAVPTVAAIGLLFGISGAAAPGAATPTPVPTLSPDVGSGVLFDDFDYTGPDDLVFADHGWSVRTETGWPGVSGAAWGRENVTFLDDSDTSGNWLMQMESSTDGTAGGTRQTEINQQRKFYEGTYASRVRFTDSPVSGPDGDQIVETFFTITPLNYDLDPSYSELDYEYLPNGGWGRRGSTFFMTTWETYRPEPRWVADNTSSASEHSYEGWHTLVLQVADGTVTYYIDGDPVALHRGKYYPETPMSINYNLWFVQDGQVSSHQARQYIEQIDWLYYVGREVLSPDDVEVRVARYRSNAVTFEDTIPAWTPPEPKRP
ncbi:MAG TPA: glycoside hydrolase family 16 protein [Aggregatilineaceae bacterium]|jgi:hypothetical protein|nr:glycoside hydrolase family 16 protein [Aggregatilineaceae bacterium]